MRGFRRPRIGLSLKACGLLDQMRGLEHVERRRFPSRRCVDEYIEIAVPARIAACPRSEQREPGYALCPERRLKPTQLADVDFDRNVCNVAHEINISTVEAYRPAASRALCSRPATTLALAGSPLIVLVALRPRAAENPLRRQIRLQNLPRHEGDVFAFGVGADRIGRIVRTGRATPVTAPTRHTLRTSMTKASVRTENPCNMEEAEPIPPPRCGRAWR